MPIAVLTVVLQRYILREHVRQEARNIADYGGVIQVTDPLESLPAQQAFWYLAISFPCYRCLLKIGYKYVHAAAGTGGIKIPGDDAAEAETVCHVQVNICFLQDFTLHTVQGRFVLLELAAQSIPAKLVWGPVAIEHEDTFAIAAEADCVP